MSFKFSSKIKIVGINPYVILPENILNKVFKEANKKKGPIPIKGTINNHQFIQTLVKFQGIWRLYVNTPMIKATGLKVGDRADFEIDVDGSSRIIPMHPKFKKLLNKNKKAKEEFAKLPASRQKEINRYLNNIKSESIREKNIDKVIKHLNGEKVDYFVILRNEK